MTRNAKLIKVSVAALLLAGCSSWNSSDPHLPPPQGSYVATEPDIVSVKLAQAADKASKALDVIANIEQKKNPTVAPIQNDYTNVPPHLMQPVSLRWSGPIDKVARLLAERAGLRFRMSGNVPDIPLVVNVDAYQQPVLYVLRDIGLQAGSRADLSVDQNEGVIEVRYAAADQSH